jgi:geranylgeranyl reductase family protein
MTHCDAVIVGGGPAGSTCARTLTRAGWDVRVVDRARFPRDKVCAGWLTPAVFPLLDLTPEEYRGTGLTLQEISGFCTSVMGSRSIETRYSRVVSYAIRRCEFDRFLLQRSGARVIEGVQVKSLERRDGAWVVNDALSAPIVIGAGGHFCPVARHLQGERDAREPVIAREAEFPLRGRATRVSGETPELFFCRDLEGYGWCVRKGEVLNIGIGRRVRGDFAAHQRSFISFLVATGRAPGDADVVWHGHAYHARGVGVRPVLADGALLVGDAAGLAYAESGEGIRPAIESGRLAAETLIAAGGRYDADALSPYATALARRYPAAAGTPAALKPVVTAAGRALMRSPTFTRRVVLDRWFLRNGVD